MESKNKNKNLAKTERHINVLKANIDKIKEFVSKGMGITNILAQLHVPVTAYYNIIKDYPEIDEARREGQAELVFKLKNELLNRCFKHTLTTTKTYKKTDLETGHETVYVEKTEKEVDGEISALHLLLKNNDKSWTDNPLEYKLKLAEFEWRKKLNREELGLKEEDPKKEDDF